MDSAAGNPAAPKAGRSGSQGVGIALVLLAATLFSSSGLFIKLLTLDGFALTGMRSAFAALTLAPFVRWRRVRFDATLALLTLAFAATQLCFVFGTRWTTAANAIALQSTAPGWVFAITCLAARRVQLPLLAPLALIGAGIAAMLAEPTHGTSLQGNLLGLASGFTYAVAVICFKRMHQPALGAVVLANLGSLASCLLLAPGAFRLGAVPLWEWSTLVYLGAVQIGLGLLCFTAGLRRIAVSQASVLALLEPLLNPLWVYLVIGELPSGYGFTGFALIGAGIGLDTWLRLLLPSLQTAARADQLDAEHQEDSGGTSPPATPG